MTTLRLNVGPARTTQGGQRFPVALGEGPYNSAGEIGAFRLPYYDAARALLTEGLDPETPLEMWRDGTLCLSGLTVGQAAELTVAENDGRPSVRDWKPRPEIEVE